jgi:hypothetical protein
LSTDGGITLVVGVVKDDGPVKRAPWSWFTLGTFNPILLRVESLVMLAFFDLEPV